MKNYVVCFFELAINDSQKEKLQSILYEGGYKDYSLNSGVCSIDNPYLEMQRRVSMAYLIIKNEDTFDEIVFNHINLFHGTNSKALLGIVEKGLVSTRNMENEGIPVLTGERYNRTEYSRNLDFISLTDVYDVAEDYSETEEKDVFNVIIGTNVESISNLKRLVISSEIS